jgi:hypothetical protein
MAAKKAKETKNKVKGKTKDSQITSIRLISNHTKKYVN